MEVIVKKWGNSAAVRIPAAVMATARLELDQAVEVRAEDGRVVIEPVKRKDFSIGDLVGQIKPGNLHDVVDTGKPAGREVW